MSYNLVVRCAPMLLAAVACLGAERDPGEVLARLREFVRSEAARIPNYTCVQTIDQVSFRPSGKSAKPPRSCPEVAELKGMRGYRLIPNRADRFRLDVRVGPDVEMYSWVGAGRFEDRSLHDLIGSGPSSTGAIGPVLMGIFGEDAPEFQFEGVKTVHGRPAYAYSFRVPVERSHHAFFDRDGGQVTIAYEGTIYADPETGAPVRLSILAGGLPPETGCCQFTTELDYRSMRVGAGEFRLPYEALQRFVESDGIEVENTVTFSSCREFRAESRVAYAGASPPAPAASAAAAPPPPWDAPAGLPVTIALAGTIDSAVAAAGDPFSGRLTKPVVDKLKNVIAPEGALVRGRVAQVQRALEVARVTILLEVETVEIAGREVPLRLTGRTPAIRTPPAGSFPSRGVPIGPLPPWLTAGRAVFQCPTSRCVIPDGKETEWVTVSRP